MSKPWELREAEERDLREKNAWQVKWAEEIGPAECPMMRRWVLVTPFGSIRLHNFLRGDNDRDAHDHPWPFLTVVLRGSYDDYTEVEPECAWCQGTGRRLVYQGEDWMAPLGSHVRYREQKCCDDPARVVHVDHLTPGSVRFRPALHRHQVKTDGCWTLVLTGRAGRQWGFWEHGLFSPVSDYFKRYGYAPCED